MENDALLDADKTSTQVNAVRLMEYRDLNSELRAEYVVQDGVTKIHLFTKGTKASFLGLKDTLAAILKDKFGEGILEWIPEMESWYVKIGRHIDGKLACKAILDGCRDRQ